MTKAAVYLSVTMKFLSSFRLVFPSLSFFFTRSMYMLKRNEREMKNVFETEWLSIEINWIEILTLLRARRNEKSLRLKWEKYDRSKCCESHRKNCGKIVSFGRFWIEAFLKTNADTIFKKAWDKSFKNFFSSIFKLNSAIFQTVLKLLERLSRNNYFKF